MQNHRITLAILILLAALILLALHRNSRRAEGLSPQASSFEPASPHQIKTRLETPPSKSARRSSASQPPSERVLASTGEQVVLQIYADRTFQLHLPDTTKDIFVTVGKDLFTSSTDMPAGVKIKIRNGAGELFTADGGRGMQIYSGPDGHGWYRPGSGSIEMPVFSYRPVGGQRIEIPGPGQAIETVPTAAIARRSSRGKLADMIIGLPPKIRNQSGLEFKLSVLPFAMPNARDSEGNYLKPEGFPRHETDWLDGNLLFDEE